MSEPQVYRCGKGNTGVKDTLKLLQFNGDIQKRAAMVLKECSIGKRVYKTYSKEFKVESVRLAAESDEPMTQMPRKLGLRGNQIDKCGRPNAPPKSDIGNRPLSALMPEPRVDLKRLDGEFAPKRQSHARITPARRGKGGRHTSKEDSDEPAVAERRASMD